jgi:hydroxyacylglutathione hydrolase
VDEIHRDRAEMTLIDVRSPDEFKAGHIPGARHLFLPSLPQKIKEIPTNRPIAVYCGTGYRASLGASMLQQAGLQDVANIPGSFQAWQHAGYEVSR